LVLHVVGQQLGQRRRLLILGRLAASFLGLALGILGGFLLRGLGGCRFLLRLFCSGLFPGLLGSLLLRLFLGALLGDIGLTLLLGNLLGFGLLRSFGLSSLFRLLLFLGFGRGYLLRFGLGLLLFLGFLLLQSFGLELRRRSLLRLARHL